MCNLLTIHILDCNVAPRLTSLNIVLSALYLNRTSLIWRIGGERDSASGNLRTTSTSFSIGFSSGLKPKYHEKVKQYSGGSTYNFSSILILDCTEAARFALYLNRSINSCTCARCCIWASYSLCWFLCFSVLVFINCS